MTSFQLIARFKKNGREEKGLKTKKGLFQPSIVIYHIGYRKYSVTYNAQYSLHINNFKMLCLIILYTF